MTDPTIIEQIHQSANPICCICEEELLPWELNVCDSCKE